jgi:ubiquitin-conjugating enzyme E2 J1
MPAEYPFKPPAIMLLTPNGRFETRKKICLSISDFHPEQWQPAWGVRTIMTALVAFFPTPADGAIGGLDHTDEERAGLATRSLCWSCDACGACMRTALAPAAEPRGAAAASAGAPAAADAAAPEACGGASAGAPASSPVASECARPAMPPPQPAAAEPAFAEAAHADHADALARQARSDGGGGSAGAGLSRISAQPLLARPPSASRAAATARADDRFLQLLAYALGAALLALILNKWLGGGKG